MPLKKDSAAIIGYSVNATNRNEAPKNNEDISEILNKEYFDQIKEVRIYKREIEDCPFARGNWLIDIYFKNNSISCVKLPIEMDYIDVEKYAKPIIENKQSIKNIKE